LFFPLEIGNKWSYDYTFVVHYLDPDTDVILDADTLVANGEVTLVGTEPIADIIYIVEETVARGGAAADTTWARLRQNSEGLFRADIPSNVPPGHWYLAGISDPPPERVRLRYPLTPGAEWNVFPGSDAVTAEVESLEVVDTPAGSFAAHRIRIRFPRQGSDDWRRVWHSRCGKVRFIEHAEIIAIDPETNERTKIVTEAIEVLTRVDLVEQRDCANSPE
jgi:hypothetical protein